MHIGCCCSCAVCIRILRFVTWSLVPVLCQKLVHLLSRSVFSGLFPGGSSAGLRWRGKVLLSSTRFRSFLFGSGINVEHVHSSGHSQVSQIFRVFYQSRQIRNNTMQGDRSKHLEFGWDRLRKGKIKATGAEQKLQRSKTSSSRVRNP